MKLILIGIIAVLFFFITDFLACYKDILDEEKEKEQARKNKKRARRTRKII